MATVFVNIVSVFLMLLCVYYMSSQYSSNALLIILKLCLLQLCSHCSFICYFILLLNWGQTGVKTEGERNITKNVNLHNFWTGFERMVRRLTGVGI